MGDKTPKCKVDATIGGRNSWTATVCLCVCLISAANICFALSPQDSGLSFSDTETWPKDLQENLAKLEKHDQSAVLALLDEQWPSHDVANADHLFCESNDKTYVLQVISETSFLSQSYSRSKGELKTFMIHGTATTNVTDDSTVNSLLLLADGTYSYATPSGAKATVNRFIAIDPSNVEPIIQEVASRRGLRLWNNPPGPGREPTWTLATVTKLSGKNVTFQNDDGERPYTRKLAELSKRDQDWITEKENIEAMKMAWKMYQTEKKNAKLATGLK